MLSASARPPWLLPTAWVRARRLDLLANAFQVGFLELSVVVLRVTLDGNNADRIPVSHGVFAYFSSSVGSFVAVQVPPLLFLAA